MYFNLSFKLLVKFLQVSIKGRFTAYKLNIKHALKYKFCTCTLEGNQSEWEYITVVTGRSRIWLHLLARAQTCSMAVVDLRPLHRTVKINSISRMKLEPNEV